MMDENDYMYEKINDHEDGHVTHEYGHVTEVNQSEYDAEICAGNSKVYKARIEKKLSEIEAANVETDPAKRSQMLKTVEDTLYNDAAFVPLHWQNLAWGAKSNIDIKPIVNAMEYPYFGDLVVKEK